MSGVVTRYVGSGIERGEIRDQKGGISDHSPGIGISSLFRDQAVPFLWDQGRKLVTYLKTRIRNLRTKMGSAMKKHTSLPPCKSRLLRGHKYSYFRSIAYKYPPSKAKYCGGIHLLPVRETGKNTLLPKKRAVIISKLMNCTSS